MQASLAYAVLWPSIQMSFAGVATRHLGHSHATEVIDVAEVASMMQQSFEKPKVLGHIAAEVVWVPPQVVDLP